MEDYLIKALAYNGRVRAYSIQTTNLVSQLQKSHDTWPVASAALGRSATIGAMMGAMLKGEEKLTIQIEGNGPLGQILIDANAKGVVRGYVRNPNVHVPSKNGKLGVAEAVGEGNIYVIKDLGLKEPYRGSIPIISGELGEDFTYYFAKSEQTPSAVAVGVLVNPDNTIRASGGFIIQILPEAGEDIIQEIENTISSFPQISSLIDEGNSPEDILNQLFNSDYNILDRMDIEFKCNCSSERIENVLINLGKKEINDMIEKEGKAEVVCQFCRAKYHYSKEDLLQILDKI